MAGAWVRPGGRIVLVGNFARGVMGVDAAQIKVKELHVLGSQGYGDSFGHVLDMVRSGSIDPSPMVSHELPLDRPSAGLELLDDPGTNKAKIVMTVGDHTGGR